MDASKKCILCPVLRFVLGYGRTFPSLLARSHRSHSETRAESHHRRPRKLNQVPIATFKEKINQLRQWVASQVFRERKRLND